MNTGILGLKIIQESLNGSKLRIITTGCGQQLSNLLCWPGASSIIDSIYIPYSSDALNDYLLQDVPEKSVSLETVKAIINRNRHKGIACLAISGAITTNRYRKGEHHAYVGILNGDEELYFYIQLSKLSEQEFQMLTENDILADRMDEDIFISKCALCLFVPITRAEVLHESEIARVIQC